MKQQTRRETIFGAVITIILILCGIMALIPLLSVLALSFSSKVAVNTNAVTLWPVGFTFASWKAILARSDMWRATLVTLMTTAVGTGMALVITSLLAYPLSKKEFGLQKAIMVMVIITMIFKAPTVPYFLTLRSIGLYNSVWAMILPHILTAYNMIVMRTFFLGFPREVEESATIDGCSPFRTLAQIVLPSSKAVIAVIGLFYAVTIWNQYQHPLYFIQDTSLYPLQMKVRQFINESSELQTIAARQSVNYTERSLKAVVVVFAILPIILVYPWLQKYFEKGAMLGSVKG
ncbi:MAG: carbohydrate ABC transporter permease [Eubacteriales bacterium]|nr:carbohydrate ABC transporter permease [Eubacteriales bacterium]